MKDELRDDLLITREDILTHIFDRSASTDDEEAPALSAGPLGVFSGLIRRLTREED